MSDASRFLCFCTRAVSAGWAGGPEEGPGASTSVLQAQADGAVFVHSARSPFLLRSLVSHHVCAANTLVGPSPAFMALSLARYDTDGVNALKHLYIRVENTLEGPRLAVTALYALMYDTKGVYAQSTHMRVEKTLAGPHLADSTLKVYMLSSTLTRLLKIYSQSNALLFRHCRGCCLGCCLRRARTLAVSQAHTHRVKNTLAGPRPAVTALSRNLTVGCCTHTHACCEYTRRATPCYHDAVSGAL